MSEDYVTAQKERIGIWFYLFVTLAVLTVIAGSIFAMKHFGIIALPVTETAKVTTDSDTEGLVSHFRNSPQEIDWYRQINGVEKQGGTIQVKTFLTNKDQFAVAICNSASKFVFDQKQSKPIPNISVLSAAGKELIVLSESSRDCGNPVTLSEVYDDKKYKASQPPPVVKIGMSYEVVQSWCGPGHDHRSFESASGKTVMVTYSDLKSKSECWGTFTFFDWKLESISR